MDVEGCFLASDWDYLASAGPEYASLGWRFRCG